MALADGIIAHWGFDVTGSGNLGLDYTGRGNFLSVVGSISTGGTPKPNLGPGCADISGGTGNYFQLADNADMSMPPGTSFTLIGWVNVDTLRTTFNAILAKTGVGNGRDDEWDLDIVGTGGSNTVFRFYIGKNTGTTTQGDGWQAVNATTFGNVPTGQWIMFCAWWDFTAKTLNIQINNGTVDSVSWPTGTTYDGATAVRVGAYSQSTSFNLDGKLDCISIFKRVLTQDERDAYWNGGNGFSYPFYVDGFYLDPESSLSTGPGTSFASRVNTLTGGGIAPANTIAPPIGAVVKVKASPAIVDTGLTASWKSVFDTPNTGARFLTVAATGFTKHIAKGITNDVVPVSPTVADGGSTGRKFASNVYGFTTNASSQTGRIAYWVPFAGVSDFSAYTRVSFWFRSVQQAIPANTVRIGLYSSSDGTGTALFDMTLPAVAANSWVCLVFDRGSALPTNVGSVGVYFDAAINSSTFHMNNMIACKPNSDPDAITLLSLVGKGTGDEASWWFPIMHIDDNGTSTTIALDATPNTTNGNTDLTLGYPGVTATQTLYRRECLFLPLTGTGTSTAMVPQLGNFGTFSHIWPVGDPTNPYVVSGGWNATDMSTQLTGEDGYSYLSARTGGGCLFNMNGRSNVKFTKVAPVRSHFVLCNTLGHNLQFDDIRGLGFLDRMIYHNVGSTVVKNATVGPGATPFYNPAYNSYYENVTALNPVSLGWEAITDGIFKKVRAFGGNAQGFNGNSSGSTIRMYDCEAKGLNTLVSWTTNPSAAQIFCTDCLFSATNETTTPTMGDLGHGRITYINYNRVPGTMRVLTPAYNITTDDTITHGTSVKSLKVAVTGANVREHYRAFHQLAVITVNADVPTTIKCWVRRSHTNLRIGIRIRGEIAPGVVAQDSYATGSVDTWEEVSVSITSKIKAAIPVEAFAYTTDGVTTYTGWWDDLSLA